MTPKLTAKQQARFDKLPERNKETMRAFWASEAQAALGISDATVEASKSAASGAFSGAAEIESSETERRRTYVARYGRDAWTRAVELAGRHRSRAAKDWGLTEHFTASEWLDLCAETDFGCVRCGEKVTLTPHHRNQLALWGKNTIDNIEPLCHGCHDSIPVFGGIREVGSIWLADQQQMLGRWKVGELVRSLPYGSGSAFGFGVVTSITPPELGSGRLYGRIFSAENSRAHECFGPCLLISDELVAAIGVEPPVQARHVKTLVRVRSPGSETLFPMDPRALSAVEPAAVKADALKWIASQERLMSKFRAGDVVRKQAGYWSEGTIMEIAPYSKSPFTGFIGEDQPPITPAAWVPGAQAQARVLWRYSGKRKKAPKETWVSLKRLKLSE